MKLLRVHAAVPFLCVVVMSLFSTQRGMAQSDDDDEYCEPNQTVTYIIAGGTFAANVVIHEFGHFWMAHAVGAKDVVMDFTPFKYGPTSLAATLIDPTGLDRGSLAAIAISGVGTTRLVAEGIDVASKSWRNDSGCPNFGERVASGAFIMGRLDFPQYVVTNLLNEVQGQEGGDMALLISDVFGDKLTDRILGYSFLIGIAGIDILIDYKRILYHLNVLSGSERMEDISRLDQLQLHVSPYVSGMGTNTSVGLTLHSMF